MKMLCKIHAITAGVHESELNIRGILASERSSLLKDSGCCATNSISSLSQTTLDMISATLVYNKLTAERGYKAFDLDRDGVVGRADLFGVARRLDLDVQERDLTDAFNYLATVDVTGRQVITKEAWLWALNGARASSVLQEVLPPQLMRMIDFIAEVIAYNDLTPEQVTRVLASLPA